MGAAPARRHVAAAVILLIAMWLSVDSRAERPSLAGAWTLNKELSDQPGAPGAREDGDRGKSGRDPRGGGGGGGGRRGGFGGRGGGFGGRPTEMDRENVARIREAMRDITNPPDRLTITQTESMVVITAADGRTTRLSPDGTKIKDENTKVERKTRWEGDKLVSDINGLPSGQLTQTYMVDSEHHQLRITVQMERPHGNQPRIITHVYDRGD